MIEIAVVVVLFLSLMIILLSCEVFTNGIEWTGLRLGLAETATGSILAAVGTAMPETIVPLIAIFLGSSVGGEEIGEGAILGAPFMLGTLAMFIGGVTLWWRHKKHQLPSMLVIRRDHAERDMKFFMAMYSLALIAGLIGLWATFDTKYLNYGIALILMGTYVFYIRKTLKDEREEPDHTCPALYMSRLTKLECESGKLGMTMIVFQVLAALIGIIIGAKFFVDSVQTVSTELGVTPMILAFLIAPIATELPEKFNSVIWYLRGKDTLGFGNITGAMVFQSSFPVSIGLFFTAWSLQIINIASIIIAMSASAWMFISIRQKNGISYKVMLASGSLYIIYIVLLIFVGVGDSI